jgi:hypothetical protein
MTFLDLSYQDYNETRKVLQAMDASQASVIQMQFPKELYWFKILQLHNFFGMLSYLWLNYWRCQLLRVYAVK